MMLGAYFTWYGYEQTGLPYPLAVVVAVLLVGALGFAVDRGLFRFTRNNLVNGLLVSIGLISIIEASVLLTWTSTPKDLTYVLPGSLRMGAILLPKMKLAVFAVLLVVIGSTYLALTRTEVTRLPRVS